MIRQWKFVSIPCRDQERALKFWTEQVGFKVETDQPMGEQRWIELRIPGAETRVVLFTPEGHEGRVGTFFNGTFETKDLEGTYRELLAKGVRFKRPPEKQPWGSMAIFLDTEDNEFLVSQE